MASIYFPADENLLALVKKIMREDHPELVRAKVDIGVTLALSAKDNQPALREHSQPTFGLTKIISPKDRVRKGIDIELYLDGDAWGTDTDAVRVAKIDHLLARLEVKKPKPKKKKKRAPTAHGTDQEQEQHAQAEEFVVDAGGRPALRMRKSDLHVPGGFRQVIERNGKDAPEFLAIQAAQTVAKAACKVFEEENTVETPVVVTTPTL